jgi:hypothetical protein
MGSCNPMAAHIHTRNATARRRALQLALAMVAALAVLAVPGVASADAAQPGGTKSVIDKLNPPTEGVRLEAVGGDAFLELTVEPGREVVVMGYQGEPYLRVTPEGTVEQNRLSPAVGLNTARFGGDVQNGADSLAPPDWEEIGNDGRVAWHDHRSHWMLEQDPTAAPDGVIIEFTIPLEVDGERVLATGRLLLVDQGLPWAPFVAVAVAIGTWFLVPGLGAPLILAAGAMLASASSWTSWSVNPPEASARPWALVLALAALLLAVIGYWRTRRAPSAANVSDPFVLAAVAALVGWWVFRIPWFTSAVIPTIAPMWFDRAATAIVCGASVAVVARVLVASQRRSVEPS